MNLTDINTVKKILSRHGFSFSKALGQNFIINPDVCPEMARLSGIEPGCGVIEIGPGIGVLTVELAKIAEKVVAIELDTRLIPVLAQTLSDYRNVEVHPQSPRSNPSIRYQPKCDQLLHPSSPWYT